MSNPFINTDQVNAVIKVRRGPETDREQVIYEDGEIDNNVDVDYVSVIVFGN